MEAIVVSSASRSPKEFHFRNVSSPLSFWQDQLADEDAGVEHR